MIVLCDLDGTLSDLTHRLHNIQKDNPDWDKFFNECYKDKPIESIIELTTCLYEQGHEIYITSGRSDAVREKTMNWLNRHGVMWSKLIMRKSGDKRSDEIVKAEWLEDGSIDKHNVLFAIDDRDRVVKMWRNLGVKCLQVADGNF